MPHRISSNPVRVLLTAVALALVLTATAPSARAQDEFTRLESMWKGRDYTSALPALIDYRDRTKTKNPQIDYMIATSACRIPQHRGTGQSFFGWILENYPLSRQNRGIIQFEKGRCSTGAPPEQLRTASPASLVGIMYSGKGGTKYRASSSGNSASEVVDPFPPEVFAARLFAPSQWKAALRSLRSQLGPNCEIERVGYLILAAPAKKPLAFPDSPDNALPNRLEIPNRAAIPNQEASPNRGATPNHYTPNRAVGPNAPVEVNEQRLPTNPAPPALNPGQVPNAGVRTTGVPPTGVSPAGVNTAGVDPRNVNPPTTTVNSPTTTTVNSPNADPQNVNPATVNAANVWVSTNPAAVPPSEAATPNQAVSQLNVQQRREPGQMAQQSLSTATEKSDLVRVGEDLERYARFFISEYGMLTPSHLITVYFTPDLNELRSLARKIHGIALARGSIGYSFPGDQSMVGWADGKAYGTFAHELFHLMMRGNFGDAPPWLDEGMAALYEVSRFENDRAVGVINWRGEILRTLWESRPTLKQLVQMDRSAFDDINDAPYRLGGSEELVAGARQAVNHATARYFMLYLQEQRQLRSVYRALFNRRVGDEPGRQAVELVESVLRRSLDQVDQDFGRWFKSLPH